MLTLDRSSPPQPTLPSREKSPTKEADFKSAQVRERPALQRTRQAAFSNQCFCLWLSFSPSSGDDINALPIPRCEVTLVLRTAWSLKVFQGARMQAVNRPIQWRMTERPRGIHVGGLFLSLVQLHTERNWF